MSDYKVRFHHIYDPYTTDRALYRSLNPLAVGVNRNPLNPRTYSPNKLQRSKGMFPAFTGVYLGPMPWVPMSQAAKNHSEELFADKKKRLGNAMVTRMGADAKATFKFPGVSTFTDVMPGIRRGHTSPPWLADPFAWRHRGYATTPKHRWGNLKHLLRAYVAGYIFGCLLGYFMGRARMPNGPKHQAKPFYKRARAKLRPFKKLGRRLGRFFFCLILWRTVTF